MKSKKLRLFQILKVFFI